MNRLLPALSVVLLTAFSSLIGASSTELWQSGIPLIPYPRQVETGGAAFEFGASVYIATDSDAGSQVRFAAGELGRILREEFGAEPATSGSSPLVRLTTSAAPAD